jgi:hypothetical protein
VAFSAFLIRQPITIAVKVASGRRPKTDLPAAVFWIAVYGLLLILTLAGLVIRGFTPLLLLAIPAVPIFTWHLYLVSKRSERQQAGVEILGSGVLALSAPAAYWVGIGQYDEQGWWLFLLTWLQSAASIVYAYLRLEQRKLDKKPDAQTMLAMGRRALFYTTFNFLFVSIFSIGTILPALLPIPYAFQWAETIWGCFKPAIGWKPSRIGFRQLFVSSVFTILFILTWNIT